MSEPRETDEVIVSEAMHEFSKELVELKTSIEQIDPEEREAKVLELRNRHLSKAEIKRFERPEAKGLTKEDEKVEALQKTYLKRQKEMMPRLEKLSYSDRVKELEALKKLVMDEE